MSVRECDRCHGINVSGARCGRRTCKTGTLCYQHLSKQVGLAVRPSTVPGAGQGLFTTRPITAAKKRIIAYTGELLTKPQVDARYGEGVGSYVLQTRQGYLDARSTQSSVAR